MTRIAIVLLVGHDWLYWNCRALWSERVNFLLLRYIGTPRKAP